ncbi:MAG: glycyl-radical enzyme activating protein [Clostridiales bacterium]|nr:glycyl-radical enzyme activating protein [Clostridiales bacterium]
MLEGTVFNIMKYSIHDGPGIRTTVFMKGCPLKCLWCHNPESQKLTPQLMRFPDRCIGCGRCVKACPDGAITMVNKNAVVDMDKCTNCGECAKMCYAGALEMAGKTMTAKQVIDEVEKDRIFYEESEGGVTFSGGEPFVQVEFLKEMLMLCKEKAIHTTVDTCGFVEKDTLIALSKYIDLFLYDIKIMDDAKHKKYTGVSNEIILDNLKELIKLGKRIFIRIPIIPGINDDVENLEDMCKYLSQFNGFEQINLLPYHNIATEKYKRLGEDYSLRDIKTPNDDRMKEISKLFESYGFKVKIGG